MSVIANILDGYIPANILCQELGIESKDFQNTLLNKVKFKNTLLVQLPLSSVKFVSDTEYVSAVLNEDERDESMYDYVLHISPKIRVGFWR